VAGGVPIRPAATVLLLRDCDRGIEVLLLRRTTRAVFSPGAHVFPGGALDDADSGEAIAQCCGSFGDGEASSALALPRGGLAFYVAAVRECFEEAGVLLARDRDTGGRFTMAHDEFVAARRRVHRDASAFAELCARERLELAVDQLLPFGHWVTPPGGPRRFDTRFFITRAPLDQEAMHDEHETTESGWFRPADVLAAHARGEVELILPTKRTLEAIADGADVDKVLTAVAR
jgi:8-oxo-dGTP pyrophosphatase MutT (NUDIX family)